MARTGGDQPYFNNYGAGTHEMMNQVPSVFSPGSGLESLGMPEHATYSQNQTTSIQTTHQRNGPNFPYPNFASSAQQTTLPTSPTFPVATASYHVPTPDNTAQPPYYQQGAGWEQQQQPPPTSAVSAPLAVTSYEFAPSHDISDPYLGGGNTYGSPPVLQSPVQPGFGFSWANGCPPNGLGPNTPSQGALVSPTARTFGSISAPSETGFSDNSDGVTYANVNERAGQQQQQQQNQQQKQQRQQHEWILTTTETIEGKNEQGSWNNGERKASSQSMTPISRGSPFNTAAALAALPPVQEGGVKTRKNETGSASTTASRNKGKLRSASRAPKNIQPRPEETPEERKSRNSHNLVEKQYRNRLNAQFESLLAVLPDSLRSSMTMMGGAGGDSDGVNGNRGGSVIPGQHPSLDFSIERRLSKAEVLDMSRRYILTLEKERDTLEKEKEQLLHSIDQLRHGQQHDHHLQHGQHGHGAPAVYMMDRNGVLIGHGHMRGVGG